jgi:AraC family transcriptional activator of tynA and feaB
MNARILESNDFGGTPRSDYEAWRALISSGFGGETKVSEPKAFTGWHQPLSVFGLAAAEHKTWCGSGLVDPSCDAYRCEVTASRVRCGGFDNYYVLFQQAGRMAFYQNDQAVELAAGDIVLMDMSRPLSFSCNNSNQRLAVNLPRQALISHLGFEPQGGLCGRGGTLATRLLRAIVRDAIENEASLTEPSANYMRLAVHDLLGALIAPPDPSAPRNTDKLFARIRAVIKEHFADPDFGPGEVAAEVGISLRYLQKLFTERGSTCVHFIHSLRLDHAARLLHRRAELGAGQPLHEIAYACGFNDYSFFSRKFRRRFGSPPGAYAGGPCGVHAIGHACSSEKCETGSRRPLFKAL